LIITWQHAFYQLFVRKAKDLAFNRIVQEICPKQSSKMKRLRAVVQKKTQVNIPLVQIF